MHLRFISFIFFIIYNSSLAQLNPTDSLSKYKAEYYLNIDSVFYCNNFDLCFGFLEFSTRLSTSIKRKI